MPPFSDPTVTDLRRELEKACAALIATEAHLARHAEANAALHCSERVMYSPLHAKVQAAITGIDHALNRTTPAPEPKSDEDRLAHQLAAVLEDLDRCEHGRHEGDPCGSSCGTLSHGNPHIRPGQTIGYGLRRGEIIMPSRDDKHDPANWRRPAPEG